MSPFSLGVGNKLSSRTLIWIVISRFTLSSKADFQLQQIQTKIPSGQMCSKHGKERRNKKKQTHWKENASGCHQSSGHGEENSEEDLFFRECPVKWEAFAKDVRNLIEFKKRRKEAEENTGLRAQWRGRRKWGHGGRGAGGSVWGGQPWKGRNGRSVWDWKSSNCFDL